MGRRRTYASRIASPDIHIADRVSRESKVAHARLPLGNTALALMPLISRGLPAYESGSFYLPGRAVDDDYSTNWRSVVAPSSTPQYWDLDISTVPAAQRTSVILHWFNDFTLAYWDNVSAQTSGNFSAVPRDYKIRGHAAAGGGSPPAIGDAGWVDLQTVTGNVYRSRQVALNLSAYNWLGFRFTAANGLIGSNDDVAMQVNIHNVAGGNVDNWLFLGDSIVSQCLSWRAGDGSPWANGPLTKQVEVARSGRYPLYQNGGVPTTDAAYANTNKAALFSGFTGTRCILGFGANDAGFATSKATYKASMAAVIAYALGTAGCTLVVLPYVTGRIVNTGADAFCVLYNAALSELAAADPTHVKLGPDFYTAVHNGTIALTDDLHPTTAGYVAMQGMWASWLLANYY